MSYNSIYQCANDPDFRSRVLVAVARQNLPPSPEAWVNQNILAVAANKAIEAPYESALATPYSARPGHNPAVISDAAILDAVAYQNSKIGG